jgi:hypothetical protein
MRGSPYLLAALAIALVAAVAPHAQAAPPHPILFVTQTPFGGDFTNLMSTFGTHRGDTDSAPRGGDLWIRHPDGSLRNLTAEAGYGLTPAGQIAVRDPMPHWSGAKALFSMVVGGTTQNDSTPVYFQIYEVTGYGVGETVQIRKLAQPADANNVTPIYASDGRILFTSDRPRNGDPRLYPQLDEYETAPIVSGLWSMQPDGSGLAILDHSPSGDFSPFVDSFGRVVFTRWDHLQRDQQADSDIYDLIQGDEPTYGAVTYASESSDVPQALAPGDEVFPEQRGVYGDPFWDRVLATETDHTFNHFFPWMMSQDGSGLEILNHLGRHELAGYIAPGRTYLDYGFVEQEADILLQLAEDPTSPGSYYAIRCPEFGTRGSGQVVALDAPPGANADDIGVEYVTHPATANPIGEGQQPPAAHVGMFRDPVVLSDGTLWASHSTSPYADDFTVVNPPYPAPFTLSSRYDFAIRELVPGGLGYREDGARLLASPIVESISYFDNDRYRIVQYSGPLWELQAVEVAPRPVPPAPSEALPAIEQGVLAEALAGAGGIDALRSWLAANDLALVVSRDVTVRADEQQDFDLKVAGSSHQHASPGSTPKELAFLQLFEGLALRGFEIRDGRRVLARPMGSWMNPPLAQAPPGSVRVAADGSVAAFVPARRALSWQTTAPDGTPVVRERYWLTFQPGEIRVCTNCHGVNTTDVFGGPIPQNEPAALRALAEWWVAPEAGTVASGACALTALAAYAAVRSRRPRWRMRQTSSSMRS